MDSLTQLVLGASVSEAVMQNKVGRKATLWGAIVGTLPDLDVFIPMGNAVKDFTYHRAESHAIFYMALATPLLVWLITRIHRQTKHLKFRWILAVFLTLFTHTILDGFTVYGTQMFLPFTNYPVGWNTIFVIDPIYTLPLLIAVIGFFAIRNKSKAIRLNKIGLVVSSIYLLWGIAGQQYVKSKAFESFSQQNINVSQTLIGPTPFNTLLWRIVGMTEEGYVEGFYSILDKSDEIKFKSYSSEKELLEPIKKNWNVNRLTWFSRGFYKVYQLDENIVISSS
jgi:inner membrane protein